MIIHNYLLAIHLAAYNNLILVTVNSPFNWTNLNTQRTPTKYDIYPTEIKSLWLVNFHATTL